MTETTSPSIVDVSGGTSSSAIQADLLDDRLRLRRLRTLMIGVAGIVLLFIGWSAVAVVDEIAKARAEILPKSRNQIVQSKDGGVLEALLVRENDRVEAGQVIARFDPTSVRADEDSLKVRRAALSIDIERWGAIADGRDLDLSAFEGAYPKLTAEARQLFETQGQEAAATVNALTEKLTRLEATTKELESERRTVSRELGTLQDTVNRLAEGARRGVVATLRVNEAQTRMLQAEARLAELDTRLRDNRSEGLVAEQELERARSGFGVAARTERSKLIEQRAEVEASIAAIRGRRGQLAVISPVTGIVKDVPDTLVGGVVPPGGTVAEIVPTEDGLILEARLQPRDVGFVKPGQPVLAKVDAFDFSRFGAVRGTVKNVSPTAFTDQRTGERYYVVAVDLEQDHVGSDAGNLLVPGMTGEADIVTGHKTVFQYLLKPVFVGLSAAFHER